MCKEDIELLEKRSTTKKKYKDSKREERAFIEWNTGTRVHTSNKEYNRQRDKKRMEKEYKNEVE